MNYCKTGLIPRKNTASLLTVFSFLVLCLPSMAASSAVEATQTANLSPEQMSDMWRVAWNSAFQGVALDKAQDEMVWQALELGSPETFASMEKTRMIGQLLTQLESRLPKQPFLGAVGQMRPMFSLFEQVGYAAPLCNCSTTLPWVGCSSPCAAPSGGTPGFYCIPHTWPNGVQLNGMCLTTPPK